MQERDQLKTGFSESRRGAKTILREVSVVAVQEFLGGERWHFAKQLVEQLVFKHMVDDDMRERLGRFIRRGHLLNALIDDDSLAQQRAVQQIQDVNRLSVCHMLQNSPAPSNRRYLS